MTPRQRIEIAQSKRRQRLAELLAIEERSADETAELERITDDELPAGEVELRAAIATETASAGSGTGDSTGDGNGLPAGIDPKRIEPRSVRLGCHFRPAAGGCRSRARG